MKNGKVEILVNDQGTSSFFLLLLRYPVQSSIY